MVGAHLQWTTCSRGSHRGRPCCVGNAVTPPNGPRPHLPDFLVHRQEPHVVGQHLTRSWNTSPAHSLSEIITAPLFKNHRTFFFGSRDMKPFQRKVNFIKMLLIWQVLITWEAQNQPRRPPVSVCFVMCLVCPTFSTASFLCLSARAIPAHKSDQTTCIIIQTLKCWTTWQTKQKHKQPVLVSATFELGQWENKRSSDSWSKKARKRGKEMRRADGITWWSWGGIAEGAGAAATGASHN
jgi:hypothetical protein